MSVSPVIITGTTQTILGTSDVATLSVELCNLGSGVPTLPGQAILTNIYQTITCTGGSFSFQVYGNDEIQVSGVTSVTFYVIRFYSSAGSLVAALPYSITGAGPINLSQLTPLNPIPPSVTNSAGGTVQSVGISVPTDIFTVADSPITGSGTIGITEKTQQPNYVWAGPSSGSPATPVFRPLVSADIPGGSGGSGGSGTIAQVSLTGQTASIGSTNLYGVSVSGMYRITVSVITTTVGSGYVETYIGYNNGVSVNTIPLSSVSLVTLGAEAGNTIEFYGASIHDITYSTVLSGSGTYSLNIQLEYLGLVGAAPASAGQNTIWSGPGSGGAGAPTFRSMVNADLPANISISGSMVSPKISTILYADQFPGSNIGQKINNAIAALPTTTDIASGNTYSAGVISLAGYAGQNVTLSTTVTINSPFVSIIGPGSGALEITSSVNGDAFRITLGSNFTVSQAGKISGFYLNGNSGASACGIHYGDIIGLTFEDLVISSFTGTSSAALWCDNTTYFTERTVVNKVHLNYNTWGWVFTNTGSSEQSSMAYNRCLDLRINITNGQIGFYQKQVTGTTAIYHGYFNILGNFLGSSKTFIKQENACTFQDNFVHITTEDDGTGGVFLQNDSTSHFSFYGNINNSPTSTPMTNSVSGVFQQQWSNFTDSTNPTPTNGGLISFAPNTLATSGQNVNGQPLTFQGSYWNGSASVQAGITSQVTYGTGTNPPLIWLITKYGGPLFSVMDISDVDVTYVGCLQMWNTAVATSSTNISLGNTTSTTATAGAVQAVPGTVLGYIEGFIGSTPIKIPYFAA